MRLDLHIHTSASDGAWSAEDVVSGAVAGGLDVIAIADHDTTAAVGAARAAGANRNLQVIPALEVSSTWQAREIHVLGYFVDATAPALRAHGERAVTLRRERMKEMISRLAAEGIEVSYEDVEGAAGPNRVNLGRPHLAKVLVAGGYVSSVSEAFDRLIGDHHPAFVPTRLLDPAGAVGLILEGGGLPVWAHPPAELIDSLLPGLMKAGLQGLEVYRPTHSRNDVIRLEGICRSTGLVTSGGSDWHTPDSGMALGDFHVTADEVEKLLTAGGM
jgi:predicted metal-dependent phosphoesterase TrpH